MLVLPYRGPAAARSERNRSLPTLPHDKGKMPTRGRGMGGIREPERGAITAPDLLREIPMRLTYRTALDGERS
jgi:hypothetical protein